MNSADIDRVRESPIEKTLDLLGFRRKGKLWACRFHDDKNPSASVYKNRLYCWPCGRNWSGIDLVMELRGMDFMSALRLLADFHAIPFDDHQATPAERREWAATKAADERDMQAAAWWSTAAWLMCESSLAAMASTDPARQAVTEFLQEIQSARSDFEKEHPHVKPLIELYHAERERDAKLTAALVHAGRRDDERFQHALATILEPLWEPKEKAAA